MPAVCSLGDTFVSWYRPVYTSTSCQSPYRSVNNLVQMKGRNVSRISICNKSIMLKVRTRDLEQNNHTHVESMRKDMIIVKPWLGKKGRVSHTRPSINLSRCMDQFDDFL